MILALEVTYRMLRSIMIAEALRMDGTVSIDVMLYQETRASKDRPWHDSVNEGPNYKALLVLWKSSLNMDVMEKKVRSQLVKPRIY